MSRFRPRWLKFMAKYLKKFDSYGSSQLQNTTLPWNWSR